MKKHKGFLNAALMTFFFIILVALGYHWTGCNKEITNAVSTKITYVNNSGTAIHMWVGSGKCNENNKLQPSGSRFEETTISDFSGKADFSVGLNGQTLMVKELLWPDWKNDDPSITVIYNGTSLVAQ